MTPAAAAPTPRQQTLPTFEPAVLTTADGTRLGARQFGGHGDERARLIVAGATAVPQAFYRRFAEYAQSRGYATLTVDFRGVGESKPPSLKGYEMRYEDWARQDLVAAIGHWHRADRPLFWVGHSFGGHALGLLPRPELIEAACLFGTGAGWHGWMPRLEQLRVQAMWKLIGPVATRWCGYLPWSRLGMGEDLPMGVYRDWRRWCSFPRYFFDDPDMPGVADEFARVRLPITAINALDDRWAPPRSRDAFMAAYIHAPVTPVDLDPATVPGPSVGHMGYFRPHAQALWAQMLDTFDARTVSWTMRADAEDLATTAA